ncbi:MAG: 50S ribosomal protein L7ae [Candidatus Aenigmarchaeota archaeon]|nr:50S ribosomal protein L7ae [Candidatus Aenigmarchaeota archaeon]
MTKFEVPQELEKKVLQTIELAKNTGKVRKGTNEVTKTIERGNTKLVVIAEDVQPPEIVMHLPILCEEKKIPYLYVSSKEELGRSTGVNVPTASACIVEAGEGKSNLSQIVKKIEEIKKG